MRVLRNRDVITTVLIWIGIFDVGLTLLLLFFWLAIAQVADPATAIVLMVVRVAIWVAAARRELGPVRRWQASWSSQLDPASADRLLIEADRALGRVEWRLTLIYIAAWELSMILSVVLGQIGVPVEVALGRAELATAAIMLVSLASCALLMRELVRALLLPRLREVAAELLERRLAVPRPPSSVGTGMHATIVAIVMAFLPGLMMLMGLVQISGVRAEASMDQLRRAEVAAAALAAGFSIDPDLGLVGEAELPEPLRELAGSGETSLRGYDRANNEAVAAVARADGTWLLARTKVDEHLGLVLGVVIGTSLVSLVMAMLVSRALWHSQRELLDGLDENMRNVAELGHVHGLARLVPLRNDELGRVAGHFNDMLDMLDELAAAASSIARGDLRVRLARPGDLHGAFRGMLDQLNRVVAQLSETTLELGTSAREIHAATQAQALAGEQQSASAGEVRTSLYTLAVSAADIASEASGVLDNAEHTLQATDAMAERIAELDRQTRGIGELLERIREIADRSDLLALNGELEAARAGDEGRAFALLAAEMRRLAERVTELVAGVHERLDEIGASGSSTVAVTERSRTLARDTAMAARLISRVTQRQREATERVVASVDIVTHSANAAAAAIAQTRAAAEGLRLQSGQLEQLLAHFELG
jgi:methyl-accepting chemotaxis protein